MHNNAKHKHIRDRSPEEKSLPRHFSVKKDVAYLFEGEQEKFGKFKNAKHRQDEESRTNKKFLQTH